MALPTTPELKAFIGEAIQEIAYATVDDVDTVILGPDEDRDINIFGSTKDGTEFHAIITITDIRKYAPDADL